MDSKFKDSFNLKEEILKEHSSKQATFIASWALSNEKHFEALLSIFMDGEYVVSQRAGYAILKAFDREPLKFEPHLLRLFRHINSPNQHVAVKRNIFRMFEKSSIPDQIEGELLDLCLSYLKNKSEVPAIRANAIVIAARISKKYPPLWQEIKLLVAEELPVAKPSFVNRFERAFKK